MTDLDLMPFGKYKGTPMQDVPASYLHWLYHQVGLTPFNKDIMLYIETSWDVLKQEAPDLIWNKYKH